MASLGIRNQTDFLRGSSDLTVHRFFDGNIGLRPNNFVPNASLTEEGDDGFPLAWDLEWALEKIVAWHVNVSRPGAARKRSVTRQTTSAVPPEEGAWTMEEPWLAGVKGAPTSDYVPPAPTLEAVPNGNRGFEGGPYGWAWGLSGRFGSTPPTAVRYFTLLNGEVPLFPVPDAVSARGVRTWDIYMTRKGSGPASLRLQRRIPVKDIRTEERKINGPWRNRGRPPRRNESGVGTPPSVQRGRDYHLVPSGFDMPVGIWRAGIQYEANGGTSLLSFWGQPIRVVGDRVRVDTRSGEYVSRV